MEVDRDGHKKIGRPECVERPKCSILIFYSELVLLESNSLIMLLGTLRPPSSGYQVATFWLMQLSECRAKRARCEASKYSSL